LRSFPCTVARAILLPIAVAATAVLQSCAPRDADVVTIRFGVSGADTPIAERSLKFYVHGIALLDEHNQPHELRLSAAAPWQSDRGALLDLAGSTTTPRNTSISGTLAASAPRYTGIRFSVGVPFDLNHTNPLTAAPPLDRSDMLWTWQSGHKFLRVDLAGDGHEWSFHLGSTGCSSASAIRPPQAPCAQPNVMRVELQGDPVHGIVHLRVEQLAAAMRAANFTTCTGEYSRDAACAAPFALTGLSTETGTCADASCSAQKLWTLE
jgi:uncharacterized repeat protein (TIGR04052 family)